jgi:hypothetical protein
MSLRQQVTSRWLRELRVHRISPERRITKKFVKHWYTRSILALVLKTIVRGSVHSSDCPHEITCVAGA